MSLASYSSGTSAAPLLGDTIHANFAATAVRFGDREALVDKATDRRWTYAELAAEVGKAAAGLTTRGVRKGDRVGIWAPNCAEWVFVQYATARIGAILVNVNPAYRVHELEYVLNQAGIHTLVAARTFKTSDYAAMIEEVRPRCPELHNVVFVDDPQWTGTEIPDVDLDRDDPINIQYTSGTTGFPKGATLSHHNILNNEASVWGGVGREP